MHITKRMREDIIANTSGGNDIVPHRKKRGRCGTDSSTDQAAESLLLPPLPIELWDLILSTLPRSMLPFLRLVCKDWRALLHPIRVPEPPNYSVSHRRRRNLTFRLIAALTQDGCTDLLPHLPLVGIPHVELSTTEGNQLMRTAIRNGDYAAYNRGAKGRRPRTAQECWALIYLCLGSRFDTTSIIDDLICEHMEVPKCNFPTPPRAIPNAVNLARVLLRVENVRIQLHTSDSFIRKWVVGALLEQPTLELLEVVEDYLPLSDADLCLLVISCIRKDLVRMVQHLMPRAKALDYHAFPGWETPHSLLPQSKGMFDALTGTKFLRQGPYTCTHVMFALLDHTEVDMMATLFSTHTCNANPHPTDIVPSHGWSIEGFVAKLQWLGENCKLCACTQDFIRWNAYYLIKAACSDSLLAFTRLLGLWAKVYDVDHPGDVPEWSLRFTSDCVTSALQANLPQVASWIVTQCPFYPLTIDLLRDVVHVLAVLDVGSENEIGKWILHDALPLLRAWNVGKFSDAFSEMRLREGYTEAYRYGNFWFCRALVTHLEGFREWYEGNEVQ